MLHKLARLIFVPLSFDEKFQIMKVIALMDLLNGIKTWALLNLALVFEVSEMRFCDSLLLFFPVSKDYDCYLVTYYGIEAWKIEIGRYRYVKQLCYNCFIKSYVLRSKIYR